MKPLPSLRKRILKSFLTILALNWLLGLLLLIAFFVASGLTPELIRKNYDSIAAAAQMREAWQALRHPAEAQAAGKNWDEIFEQNLNFEKGNITEPGEKETVAGLDSLWQSSKTRVPALPAADFRRMNTLLQELVRINENALFFLGRKSLALRKRVLLIVSALFVAGLFLASLVADRLAQRLAKPLKSLAEVFNRRPLPDKPLDLPAATSLEHEILGNEISQLWERLMQTERLNLEELSMQRKLFQTVFESVEDGLLVLDNEEKVLHCNEGMALILGLPPSQVLGQPWRGLASAHQNYAKLKELFNPQLAQEKSTELFIGDLKRIFTARWRDVFNDSGRNMGRLYLLQDITEKKQREKLKADFLGVLSHEIKTPLQSLGTATELLFKRRPQMDEDARILIETLYDDVSRIRGVANDLIQVSLVDLHSMKFKIERVALSQLLPEWLKPFQVLARDKDLRIDYEQMGSPTIWADLDPVKFPWAVSNLLANALRVSPQGGRILVSVSDLGNEVRIEIADEGPGVPEAIRERIFEAFFQSPTPQAAAGLLGLGLSIAREVTEAHGGHIECVPGRAKGCLFRISLPVRS